jgi:hypothetical protein
MGKRLIGHKFLGNLLGNSLIETARNDSYVITIVGYHGNSVYRVVASIPIWVTVTSLAIWQPVGGSHGRLPQHHSCGASTDLGHLPCCERAISTLVLLTEQPLLA